MLGIPTMKRWADPGRRGSQNRIVQNVGFSQGKEVLSHQTNLALKQCRGDWAFYLSPTR